MFALAAALVICLSAPLNLQTRSSYALPESLVRNVLRVVQRPDQDQHFQSFLSETVEHSKL